MYTHSGRQARARDMSRRGTLLLPFAVLFASLAVYVRAQQQQRKEQHISISTPQERRTLAQKFKSDVEALKRATGLSRGIIIAFGVASALAAVLLVIMCLCCCLCGS